MGVLGPGQATVGPGILAIACLIGILARIARADAHQNEIKKLLLWFLPGDLPGTGQFGHLEAVQQHGQLTTGDRFAIGQKGGVDAVFDRAAAATPYGLVTLDLRRKVEARIAAQDKFIAIQSMLTLNTPDRDDMRCLVTQRQVQVQLPDLVRLRRPGWPRHRYSQAARHAAMV